MITRIELDGFKSFEKKNLDLRPFTLLTGLNSSGKSSVIQALLMVERATKGNGFLLDDHGTGRELTNTYAPAFNITAFDDRNKSISLHNENDRQTILNWVCQPAP